MTGPAPGGEPWPPLPFDAWADTCATVHRWTQAVGMVRMELAPPVNHWWHAALQLTARGLTTAPIPYRGKAIELAFDFQSDRLTLEVSDGRSLAVPLRPMSVRAFHRRLLGDLAGLGVDVRIPRVPAEIPGALPFDEDETNASYDGPAVRRFAAALLRTAAVLARLRGGFLGKASPVHFFWGSFDLALTYFSGRRAPPRADLDAVGREAYSHEVISFGFWPGSPAFRKAAFYAYAAPVRAGLDRARLEPEQAYWHAPLGEFLLDYDAVAGRPDADALVQRFYASAYAAAADVCGWSRAELERAPAP